MLCYVMLATVASLLKTTADTLLSQPALSQWIDFKLATLPYKTQSTSQPKYRRNLFPDMKGVITTARRVVKSS